MPQLLRDILCVIETFHKYASEDGDKATLTPRELKQLLESELGDFLQPHVFRAMERKLNLLDVDRHGTVSFEEFVLTIFNILKLCCLEIKSSLASEPRQTSNPETDYVDIGTTTHEEGEADGRHPVSPWEGIETHNLSGRASEYGDSKNQHLEEDKQEIAQDVPVTEEDGAQLQTNTPSEGWKQTSSLIEEIPQAEDRPLRRQGDMSDQFGEDNLELQTEVPQRPSGDQEVVTERGMKKHSETQAPLLQREEKARSEHSDLPGQASPRKSSQRQNLSETVDANRTPPETTDPEEPKDDSGTSETHELSAQEREHKPSDPSEISELHDPGDSESEVDTHGGSVLGGHDNKPGAQKQEVPDENSRAQKLEVLSIQEEDVSLPEEQDPPAREGYNSPGLGTKGGPVAAREPDGHLETQESAAASEDSKSLEAESSSGLDADSPDQTSVMKLPGKEGSRKELKVQDSDTKEDGAPEPQETLVKNLDEDNSASPTTYHGGKDHTTLEEEDESPQEPSEIDDQKKQ